MFLVCWIMVITANAQFFDTIKPIVSPRNAILIRAKNDKYYLAKNLNSFGSLSNRKHRLVIDEKFSKYVYNKVFKDSLIYEKYKAILTKEGIYKPLLKINKCYINNKISLFCSGVNIKPIVNRFGQPDNLLYPFYFLVMISRDSFTIETIRTIGNLPNDEYYLLESGDFFENKDELYFTVAKDEIVGNNSKILGKWINKDSDSLVFSSFSKINIPKYFKTNNLNYNLISFIYDDEFVLFNTVNSIFNAKSGEEIPLKINPPPNVYRDMVSADVEINSINLSFEIDDKYINLLRREKETLYYTKFERNDGSVIKNIKIPDSVSICILNNDNASFINNGVLSYVDEHQQSIVQYKIE